MKQFCSKSTKRELIITVRKTNYVFPYWSLFFYLQYEPGIKSEIRINFHVITTRIINPVIFSEDSRLWTKTKLFYDYFLSNSYGVFPAKVVMNRSTLKRRLHPAVVDPELMTRLKLMVDISNCDVFRHEIYSMLFRLPENWWQTPYLPTQKPPTSICSAYGNHLSWLMCIF